MAESAKKAATRTTKAAAKNVSSPQKKSFPLWIVIAGLVLVGGFFVAKKMSSGDGGVISGGMKMVEGDVDSTNIEQWSYANGFAIGKDIEASTSQLDETSKIDNAIVAQAIEDVLLGRDTKLSEEQVREIYTKRNEEAQILLAEQATENLAAGTAFLATYKADSSVKTASNGVLYKIIASGSGDPIGKRGALVQYAGKHVDGSEFDSSAKNGGNPVPFESKTLIPGLRPVFESMSVGDKYEIVVPGELAYAEQGIPGVIEPNETLIFEIEVTGIQNIAAQQEVIPAPTETAESQVVSEDEEEVEEAEGEATDEVEGEDL